MAVQLEVGVSLDVVLASQEARKLSETERKELQKVFEGAATTSGSSAILSQTDVDTYRKTAGGQKAAAAVGLLAGLVKPGSTAPRAVALVVSEKNDADFAAKLTEAAKDAGKKVTAMLLALPPDQRDAALKAWSSQRAVITKAAGEATGLDPEGRAASTSFGISFSCTFQLTLQPKGSSGGAQQASEDPFGVQAAFQAMASAVVVHAKTIEEDAMTRVDTFSIQSLSLWFPLPASFGASAAKGK